MARTGGVDRGLFQRKGVWWIRWVCPYANEHMEKIGTAKDLARLLRDPFGDLGLCVPSARGQSCQGGIYS